MCRTPPYPASRKQLPAEVLTLLAAAACHSNPCHCCWRRTVHIPVRCATALLRHLQAAQQQVVKTAVHTCSTHTHTQLPQPNQSLCTLQRHHTPRPNTLRAEPHGNAAACSPGCCWLLPTQAGSAAPAACRAPGPRLPCCLLQALLVLLLLPLKPPP